MKVISILASLATFAAAAFVLVDGNTPERAAMAGFCASALMSCGVGLFALSFAFED